MVAAFTQASSLPAAQALIRRRIRADQGLCGCERCGHCGNPAFDGDDCESCLRQEHAAAFDVTSQRICGRCQARIPGDHAHIRVGARCKVTMAPPRMLRANRKH